MPDIRVLGRGTSECGEVGVAMKGTYEGDAAVCILVAGGDMMLHMHYSGIELGTCVIPMSISWL